MAAVDTRLEQRAAMPTRQLRTEWLRVFGHEPLPDLTRDLLLRALSYRVQERGAAPRIETGSEAGRGDGQV